MARSPSFWEVLGSTYPTPVCAVRNGRHDNDAHALAVQYIHTRFGPEFVADIENALANDLRGFFLQSDPPAEHRVIYGLRVMMHANGFSEEWFNDEEYFYLSEDQDSSYEEGYGDTDMIDDTAFTRDDGDDAESRASDQTYV